MVLYYVFLTAFVLIVAYSYVRWKVEIYQPFYILLYGVVLTLVRLFSGAYHKTKRVPLPEVRLPRTNVPASVAEYASHYNLMPNEVILGFQNKKPVRVNITKAHTLIGATSGGGKALPLDALVLTPFGFKSMREIHTNSQVTNPDGTVSRVIYEYPHENKRVYKFVMQDGATVESSEDHLWAYRLAQGQWNSTWKVGTTTQLKNLLESGKHVLLPMTKPVSYSLQYKQSIDPYFLGVLLGDGCITGTSPLTVTSADSDLVDYLNQTSGYSLYKGQRYAWHIKEKKMLAHNLKKLKLLGTRSNDKFIPKNYLYGSIEVRYELLRGLMDTDGTIDVGGRISFTTVSEVLARDVQTLIRSLGGKATMYIKNPFYRKEGLRIYGQKSYNLYVRIDHSVPLFRLERKLNRVREYNGGVSEIGNRIKTVEYVGEKDCKCIAIDNPNGLFITNDFVVTHNSVSVHSILTQLFTNPAFKGRVFLLDMKSHPKDRLDVWEPLVEAYVQRDYDGGVTAAITTLGYIEQTLRDAQDRPTIVIIDEVYPLTQNKIGDKILGTIASQLRLNGALIVTVQHPHHTVLKTFTKHNIERRLCGVVLNESQAETILEVKPHMKLPFRPGEFILREPGRNSLVALVAQEVGYEEVEYLVQNILERKTEEDWRLRLYREVTEGKKPGSKVVGVRTIKNEDYTQEKVLVAYRNFANAGIFNEPKKGQSYTVALPYPEGVSTLLNMDWQQNPDSVIE